MNCIRCGEHLMWSNDFDAEEYGYEQFGVVSVYICSCCNTTVEVTTFFSDEDVEF